MGAAYENLNFYCIEPNQDFDYNPGIHYKLTAKVEISNDSIKSVEMSGKDVTVNTSDKARELNWILNNILLEAKGKDENDRKAARIASGFRGDPYQWAVWLSIFSEPVEWEDMVFTDGTINTLVGELNGLSLGAKSAGEAIFNAVTTNVGSSYSSASISNKTTTTEIQTTETIGDDYYTVLGPFKYSYTGTVDSQYIYIDDSRVTDFSLIQYEGTSENIITKVPNGEDFFIKVLTDNIVSATNLKIYVKVTSSVPEIESTLYFFTSYDTDGNESGFQNMLYVDTNNLGTKESMAEITDTFSLGQESTITIQKQDASGNNLNVSGIKFEVYNTSNELVGTLVTDATGETGTLDVAVNEEYTIKETLNNAYGYKSCTITDARIVSGGGTLSIGNGGIKVNVNQASKIAVKNAPQLGQLTIDKKGDNNQSLEGVKFVVYKGDKYLKLNDDSVTTPITTSNTGLDMSGATTVSTADEATKFITNSSGKIVLNNLEIYSSSSTKYEYWVYEMSNEYYGYNDHTLGEITVTGGNVLERPDGYEDWARFDITSSTTVTINNTRQLGNIKIVKVGNNGNKLQGVKFVVEIGSGKYLQLKNNSGSVVNEVTGTVTINEENKANSLEYKVEYTTNRNQATTFITNSSGEFVVNNLEVYKSKNSKYSYTIRETDNPNYGYAATEDVSKTTELRNGETQEFKISNTISLGKLEIEKVEKDDNTIKLPDVEFKVKISSGTAFAKYIALYNTGGFVSEITGAATINKENKANSTEYRVEYVDNEEDATTFVTDSNGKFVINNLEVYKSKNSKYSYTIFETYNPNYGYGGNKEEIKKELDNTTVQVKVKNSQELGNIAIDALGKHDKDYTDIKLSDVGFKLRIRSTGKTAYVALYDKNGDFKQSIKETATINSKNKANSTEYRVEYTTDWSKATIFLTGDKGQLKISNLEKNELLTGNRYKYDLIEVSNPHYGYETNDVTVSNITINKGQTTEVTVANKQSYIKLSGYVWVEHSPGKGSGYDGVYNVSTDTPDVKLTDLYIKVNGKLTQNTNAQVPVEIKLRDRTTGQYIKTLPDSFDSNGKYTFEGVEVDNLSKYEVVFIYDGYSYTTIASNLVADNGSKVKEVEEERRILNNKFGVVKDNNEIVSTDGNDKNSVRYTKKGQHESSVASLIFEEQIVANTNTNGANISATTYTAGYYLEKKLDELKKPRTTPIDVIDNVNMGIVLREQPKIQIGSDIYQVYIEVNGKEYTYEYDSRKDHYENVNGDEVGVKFEQENLKNRYTKTIYSSDVQALKDGKTSMKVSVVYKIKLSNKSTTLTSSIREITNYYDNQAYESRTIAIGASIEEVKNNTQVSNYKVVSSGNATVQGAANAYKSARIKLGDSGIQLKAGENKDVYIKFNVSKEAIIRLLQGTSTYHNATEIMSYSTYYGAQTNKIIDAQTNQVKGFFTTDKTSEGNIYAGIDRASQVGNIELKLINHSSGDGTKVLDTTNFEDDTTSAPSFVLEASESRRISGTIWEDSSVVTEEKERFGDGKYDATNEKPIADVTVELYHLGEDGTIGEIAKYSNGVPIRTKANANGEYTLGYKAETGKHYGVLPGKYVIKYTYNNESYIVAPNGNTNLNVNDYKSTIITSDLMKDIFEKEKITYDTTDTTKINQIQYEGAINERWYLIEKDDRYSDAIDNIELRNSLDEESVIYSNYKDSIEPEYVMDAYTPVMDIGVEFTSDDSGIGYTLDERGKITDIDPVRVDILGNIDFGIVERPNLEIEIDKNITGLEITAQNGTSIIPYGNPSDLNSKMQYVKKLDDMVSIEIEADLLQGARLSMEYTITLKNLSETDYMGTEYYYFGNKDGAIKREIIINKLVDYLDSDLIIDRERTEESGSVWTEYTNRIEELLDADDEKQYISDDVYSELQTKNYTVLLAEFDGTEIFNQLDEKELKLYATKYLAVSDSIVETNSVEIIELSGAAGRRTIKGSIPGNHIPGNAPGQNDEDYVRMIITPPTGTTVNYTLYIIAVIVTFAILVSGIVIIKKKIIK